MKKLLFLSSLLLILLTISCKTGTNNNSENLETETVAEDYFFPEELAYNKSISEVLTDKLCPIGWSKNGNFAYIIEPVEEGLGNYMMGLIIINLINDEVVWDWYTDPVQEEELYREEIWKKNYDKFKDALNKYEIIQVRNMEIQDPYFIYDKHDFSLRLETSTSVYSDMNIELVSDSKIYIKSPDLGEKMVADTEYEASMILGQQIAGCIVSPFEDRIAIIIKSERWGYEGPPNVVEFEIFGANLSTGFQN